MQLKIEGLNANVKVTMGALAADDEYGKAPKTEGGGAPPGKFEPFVQAE